MNQSFGLFRFYIQRMVSLQTTSDLSIRPLLTRLSHLVHSPDEIVAVEKILKVRREMNRDTRAIAVHDFGVGRRRPSGDREGHERRVSEIHRSSAVPHRWGILLFRIVRELKPKRVLELGTNLGVSACYIQTALDLNNNGGRLMTVEGDPTLAAIAKGNLAKVSSHEVDVVNGRFDDVLPSVLKKAATVDMAFIDGHHEEAALYRYYQTIRPFMSGGVVVLDDLYPWNRGLRRSWARVKTEEGGSVSIDLLKLGFVFLPHPHDNK